MSGFLEPSNVRKALCLNLNILVPFGGSLPDLTARRGFVPGLIEKRDPRCETTAPKGRDWKESP